jgi:hypothetical protein
MNIRESIVYPEEIKHGDDDILVPQIMTSPRNRQCERCGEVELVPGTLHEVHHGPACHEGFTELLCKNCHQKASFDQGYYPESVRNKNRSFDEKCSAIWLGIFNRLTSLYPDDPSVTPFIMQQQKNLEVIYKFDDRADAQERTLQRKIARLGCDNPECKICREADIRVLTDKIPKESNRFQRRTMGLKGSKKILCLNCFAKLPFAQIYWAEAFRAKERSYFPTLLTVLQEIPNRSKLKKERRKPPQRQNHKQKRRCRCCRFCFGFWAIKPC